MTPFTRGSPPAVLVEVAQEATKSFVERRARNPSAEFKWPQRDGRSILEPIRDALAALTHDHCSYCDGFPIDSTGKKEIDHFKPKFEFPDEAFSWPNLYLVCSACNGVKLAVWNEQLIRPDEPGYQFDRYFFIDGVTGELHPNPAASPADRARALETIRVFGLQRSGLCIERRKAIMSIRAAGDQSNPYRFLDP
ncbi:MAG: hypothetical protein ACOZQL_19545 [Myxococcota bacterium]